MIKNYVLLALCCWHFSGLAMSKLPCKSKSFGAGEIVAIDNNYITYRDIGFFGNKKNYYYHIDLTNMEKLEGMDIELFDNDELKGKFMHGGILSFKQRLKDPIKGQIVIDDKI